LALLLFELELVLDRALLEDFVISVDPNGCFIEFCVGARLKPSDLLSPDATDERLDSDESPENGFEAPAPPVEPDKDPKGDIEVEEASLSLDALYDFLFGLSIRLVCNTSAEALVYVSLSSVTFSRASNSSGLSWRFSSRRFME